MPADVIKSPADMRRELQRIAAGLYPLDDPQAHSLTASIVRACLQAGRYEGWSGEDTYTMLAWQLLQAADRYGRIVLQQETLRPPSFIWKPAEWSLQPMEAAPKDRVIVLWMPEMFGVWDAGPWRGCWSHAKQAWALHLPFAIEGKAGMAELNEGAPQPIGWMEMQTPSHRMEALRADQA
jgi:hypothetical protein